MHKIAAVYGFLTNPIVAPIRTSVNTLYRILEPDLLAFSGYAAVLYSLSGR